MSTESTEHLPADARAFTQFLLILTIMGYMIFVVTTKYSFLPHSIVINNCLIQRSLLLNLYFKHNL